MLNGCIPVVIMDNTHAVFETVLDHSKFSIRVAEKDIGQMVEILQVNKVKLWGFCMSYEDEAALHVLRGWSRVLVVLSRPLDHC